MLQLIVCLTFCIGTIAGYRGPHHPKGHVCHQHYVPVQSVKLTQDEELLHDVVHLAEDMGSLGNHIDVSEMNAQQLEFHWFNVHDIDNNKKLDGLELLRAVQHTQHDDDVPEEAERTNELPTFDIKNPKGPTMLDFTSIVDRVLEEDDFDNDGFLGYKEYVLGRQKVQDEKTTDDVEMKI